LEDTRGDLPGFPDDVLPPRLLGWMERAAYGAGVRTDHVAIPLLGRRVFSDRDGASCPRVKFVDRTIDVVDVLDWSIG
jgi:hypothetical protein